MAGARTHDEATVLVIGLFEQYHVAVFAYLYRLVRDREWADDLTEDTFLRLFEARHRLPQVENRRAWIYRIATNLAFRALKRRNRFAWLPWRQDDSLHASAPDPSDQVQSQSVVEGVLAALSPTERAPLLLYYHYGLTVREVAEALDLSEGAVRPAIEGPTQTTVNGYLAFVSTISGWGTPVRAYYLFPPEDRRDRYVILIFSPVGFMPDVVEQILASVQLTSALPSTPPAPIPSSTPEQAATSAPSVTHIDWQAMKASHTPSIRTARTSW